MKQQTCRPAHHRIVLPGQQLRHWHAAGQPDAAHRDGERVASALPALGDRRHCTTYPTLAAGTLAAASKAGIGFPTLPGLRATVPEPDFIHAGTRPGLGAGLQSTGRHGRAVADAAAHQAGAGHVGASGMKTAGGDVPAHVGAQRRVAQHHRHAVLFIGHKLGLGGACVVTLYEKVDA